MLSSLMNKKNTNVAAPEADPKPSSSKPNNNPNNNDISEKGLLAYIPLANYMNEKPLEEHDDDIAEKGLVANEKTPLLPQEHKDERDDDDDGPQFPTWLYTAVIVFFTILTILITAAGYQSTRRFVPEMIGRADVPYFAVD